ncbi:tetratricopeptide repeat protein [Pontibacter sp. MBLB2868]|uniref:tetratricopeptide repeat protein n=1 Tax=Pontibacter sp. MBLB2868 TaxID=3451555 RepID=UPI003F75194E
MKTIGISVSTLILVGCGAAEVQDARNATASGTQVVIPLCKPPATADTLWYTLNQKAPLLEGLAGINFKISTNSAEAQKFFNQGLMLAFGFNHAEAARSFFEATRQDPSCAMCYWGYAYVLGPNYNAGMEPDNYSRAYQAVQQAKRLASNATPQERELILALEKRYPADLVADRSSYDQEYAEALAKLNKTYPTDPHIATMYAEAVMDQHPWDIWQKNGQPQPWTETIIATLQQAMKIAPEHAGANHLYIHATEASKHPEDAYKSARLLETLVPGAGHLVHMPSHTYIRTGDYHAGTLANLRAVKADSIYTTACHAQGIYPLAYYPHNYHFMAATATLEGNSKIAMLAAGKVADQVYPDLMKEPGWETLQHYYTIPYNVAIKFGLWDEVLQMQNKDTSFIYPEAIRHYAYGMAYAGKNDLDQAQAELAKLKELGNKPELKEMTIWGINSMQEITAIAQRVLEGTILAKQGKYEPSIKLLREATAIEDNLNYNEPPDWFFSVRHHLGAVLLKAENYDEAVAVYKQDLQQLPRNGWALHGLAQAYAKIGDADKANSTQKAFDDAWQWADIMLEGSEAK